MARPSPYPDPRASRAPAYSPAPPAARGPGAMLWVAVGVGVVVLVVGATLVFRLARKPRGGGVAANVPASFFQQATTDFAEARRLLDEGRLADSADKFDDAQAYRRKGGDKTVGSGQTFETWCAAREREYRSAAASVVPALPERVATGRPSVVEVDTFLARFGTDDARAAWQAQRPALEKRAAVANAARAYRVEWAIQGVEGNALEDLGPGAFTALSDAIAARLGGGPLLPAADAPGVKPEEGLGNVRVGLVYAEATYSAERTGRESDIKVPAILEAEVVVTTNKKRGRWDGPHRYTARVSPPRTLKENEIAGARGDLQRALLAQVVERVKSAPARERPDE